MGDDERPALYTIPTELERADAYMYVAGPLALGIAGWYFARLGIHLAWLIPPGLAVMLWMLSAEPVTDLDGIGTVATWLRSKLGLRQVHEWVLAFLHFWRLAVWPVWRSQCEASFLSTRLRTTRWLRRLSKATRCKVSLVYFKGFRIRSS